MIKRLFSLLFSFMTFFLTACSSPAQKTDSIYKETTKEAVSVIFEETTKETVSVIFEETTKETVSVIFEETTKKHTSTTQKETTTSNKKATSTIKETTTVATTKCNTTTTTLKPITSKPTTTKPVATKAPETTTQKVDNLPDYYPETEIIALFNSINKYRTENGLTPLLLDTEICKLAYLRAQEQELAEGHTRPNDKKFSSIFREYNLPTHKYVGENIALVWANPSTRPLELWKTSESHNQNMLDKDWVRAGIALYINSDGRYNIVQLFASN